jgi:predicted GNAT family acetyltransferase
MQTFRLEAGTARSPQPRSAATLALDDLVALLQQALALAILALLLFLDVGTFLAGHDVLPTDALRWPTGWQAAIPGIAPMQVNSAIRRSGSPHSVYNRRLEIQSETDQMTDVVNNKTTQRYELAVDGHIAATCYEIAGHVITFVHTEVPPELGGKGIGSKLVKAALDQVRTEGLKVIAQCPFVKAWIDKHPDYAGLLQV